MDRNAACGGIPALLACGRAGAASASATRSRRQLQRRLSPSAPSLAPSMTGPLHLNSNPLHVDGGPLGPIYVSGVISGLGLVAGPSVSGRSREPRRPRRTAWRSSRRRRASVQFYAQAGGYSFPSLGTPYFKAKHYVMNTYGVLPVAYVKIAPSSDFNVQVGKLYTLQGAENAFTFQNFNIERGLLWNQTSTDQSRRPGELCARTAEHQPVAQRRLLFEEVQLAVGHHRLRALLKGQRHVRRGRQPRPHEQVDLRDADRAQQWPALFPELDAHRWAVDDPALCPVGACPDANERSASCTARRPTARAILGKYSFNDQWALAARAEIINSTGSLANGAPSLRLRTRQRRLVADAHADLAEGHLLRPCRGLLRPRAWRGRTASALA